MILVWVHGSKSAIIKILIKKFCIDIIQKSFAKAGKGMTIKFEFRLWFLLSLHFFLFWIISLM